MPLGVPVSPAPPGSLLSATAVTDSVGGGIVAVSATSPAVLTFAADHGLQSGSTIVVAGTATTPTTVGAFVATVVSSNQVSIPVAVASVATGTGTATVKALQQQVGVANFPATQPVSGSVSVSNLPGTQPVSGTVGVSNFPATQPVSAATLPLPTGALAAAQLPATLGQKAMAGSASVTLASDQSAVPTTLATAPALVAGEAHIGALGGATVAVSGSVTRPANTTAYAAGQVVGTASTDVIAIANAARKTGGSGVILDALIVDQGGAAASAALELYLFTASPTVQADQVALALVAADLAALVAVVPVAGSYVTNVAATISGSRVYPVPSVNAGFVCAGGSTTLYGVLVQRAAFTPISAEAYSIVLQISQD